MKLEEVHMLEHLIQLLIEAGDEKLILRLYRIATTYLSEKN